MRYPVVLLDVGETLVGPRESFGAVYATALASVGVDLPAERFEKALRTTWDELDLQIPRGKDRYSHYPGGERGYWLRFAGETIRKASGRPVPEDVVERALRQLGKAFMKPEAWQVYPDVMPTLDRLRASGVRLAVVSNWDSRLPAILDFLGLSHYFEKVVVSCFEGVEKPDPAIFTRALNRLGVEPGVAIHVGDRKDLDFEGARSAGVDSIVIDRRNRVDDTVPSISDLSSLPEIAMKGLP